MEVNTYMCLVHFAIYINIIECFYYNNCSSRSSWLEFQSKFFFNYYYSVQRNSFNMFHELFNNHECTFQTSYVLKHCVLYFYTLMWFVRGKISTNRSGIGTKLLVTNLKRHSFKYFQVLFNLILIFDTSFLVRS